jgi:hypothetical protein
MVTVLIQSELLRDSVDSVSLDGAGMCTPYIVHACFVLCYWCAVEALLLFEYRQP